MMRYVRYLLSKRSQHVKPSTCGHTNTFIKTLAIFFCILYNLFTALDGEVADLCNLQAAIVGLITAPGLRMEGLLPLGGVDVKVSCNVCL